MKIVKAPFKWFISGFSGKTSWEWLELLIVPVGLAIGAFYLESRVEARQEQIADERSKQETLTSYFEQMKDLLVEEKLRDSDLNSEVRSVARAITTTTIKELGASRNALLVDFLAESNLTGSFNNETEDLQSKRVPILIELNLSSADLSSADLRTADLHSTDLSFVSLSSAMLRGADLSSAVLRGANLRDAELRGADLNSADLRDADLRGADLNSVDLSSADLRGADLRKSNFDLANLSSADLRNTLLSRATLGNANLSSADLRGARKAKQSWIRGALLCETKLPEDINLDPNRDCD